MFVSCSWNLIWNGFEKEFDWITLGLWFLKLTFESCHSMCLQMFSRNLAQEDRIWYLKLEFWTWNSNMDFPDFGRPLERGKCRSSGEIELPASCTVHQSARAEEVTLERRTRWHARAGVERRFHLSSTFWSARAVKWTLERGPLFACPLERGNLRSSGTLFHWKFWKCFLNISLHPHPILGILRPSLRHLNEDIDVEHTEAN